MKIGLVTSGRKFTPSTAAVKFVANQAKLMKKYGKQGQEVLADFQCWADGVNAFNLRERAPADRMPHVGLTEAIAESAGGMVEPTATLQTGTPRAARRLTVAARSGVSTAVWRPSVSITRPSIGADEETKS